MLSQRIRDCDSQRPKDTKRRATVTGVGRSELDDKPHAGSFEGRNCLKLDSGGRCSTPYTYEPSHSTSSKRYLGGFLGHSINSIGGLERGEHAVPGIELETSHVLGLSVLHT